MVFGMFEHKNRHRLHTSSSLRKITNLLTRGVYSVPKNEQLFEMSLKGADYYIFSGKSGIQTHGTAKAVRRISSPVHSITLASFLPFDGAKVRFSFIRYTFPAVFLRFSFHFLPYER